MTMTMYTFLSQTEIYPVHHWSLEMSQDPSLGPQPQYCIKILDPCVRYLYPVLGQPRFGTLIVEKKIALDQNRSPSKAASSNFSEAAGQQPTGHPHPRHDWLVPVGNVRGKVVSHVRFTPAQHRYQLWQFSFPPDNPPNHQNGVHKLNFLEFPGPGVSVEILHTR